MIALVTHKMLNKCWLLLLLLCFMYITFLVVIFSTLHFPWDTLYFLLPIEEYKFYASEQMMSWAKDELPWKRSKKLERATGNFRVVKGQEMFISPSLGWHSSYLPIGTEFVRARQSNFPRYLVEHFPDSSLNIDWEGSIMYSKEWESGNLSLALTLPLTVWSWRFASFLWPLVSYLRKERRKGVRIRHALLILKVWLFGTTLSISFHLNLQPAELFKPGSKLLMCASLCDNTSITFGFWK